MCYTGIAVAASVAGLYFLFDVNYFIRIALTIIFGRFFQRKIKATDKSTIYGMVTTQDVDIFLRFMNNARYLRELDFARFLFYDRSGIYRQIVKNKGNAMQTASSIRYRRTIPIFSIYKIETRSAICIITVERMTVISVSTNSLPCWYWDPKAIYIEQRFVTLRDGFVRAIALSKQGIVNVNVEEMMSKLVGPDFKKPAMPEEIDHWVKSNEVSSIKLRKAE
ncbi:hypothetical protein L9F63_011354 [Diploptera punctata]|uniref:Protein THEM6 n=1 Tax=Diploptera punctata TaxID=6984 RepID=A0AAD8EPK7_DIPPU|nr:hypothetical protein L9F63_011354 [Diploptera punctata]